MKVCLFNDSFPPLIDGVANTVCNYADNLPKFGASPMVVTPEYPDTDDSRFPYPVMRYSSFGTERFLGYRTGNPMDYSAVQEILDFAPDIYHSHCPFASNAIAGLCREGHKAPMVFTYHTKFDVDIANAVRNHLMQEMACNATVYSIAMSDEVWVVSEGAGRNLRSLGYKGDYIVMRNGVEYQKGKADPDAVAAVRAKRQLPEGVPVFLFVGRIMWYKGLKMILDSMAGLKDAGFDFRMMFIGGGQDLEEVKAYSETLRLGDKVIFTGPIRDREELRAHFGAADLFMFLSDYDTNGIVVREAAACGTPSMLLRGSAAAEEVTHMQNGVLVERSDASVAAMLARFCMEPHLLRPMGDAAMDQLYFSWQDSVEVAHKRYEYLSERFKSGDMKLKKNLAADFIDNLMDARTAFHKARSMSTRLMKEFAEQFTNLGK